MGACLCMSTASRFQSATPDMILNPFPAFRTGNQEAPIRGYAGAAGIHLVLPLGFSAHGLFCNPGAGLEICGDINSRDVCFVESSPFIIEADPRYLGISPIVNGHVFRTI
ncbi:hypothetical protein An11g05590 [Aspergillus niger]|uniref:Uncharacterized protein n=2 Tax=Aspergillus niger TaxID=5061 RepID=A2QWL2_ASPNC|nr:hypothetical protein An11g05590 [Aspergillus niger]CAK40716.1 hypothetical protein An11g05590 [Aspergillus niger]